MFEDVVICIPSKRKPPVRTLQSIRVDLNRQVFIIAGPNVYAEHKEYYRGYPGVTVLAGVHGMSPQVHRCYIEAAEAGFPWYFRMDDDLAPKTYVHKDGRYPELEEVIEECKKAANALEVGLVGFFNGTNRYWMSEGIGRTYGLIHGGTHLCRSARNPERYLDPTIVRYEDVYRSCAHREEDGAVGRVKFIGVDKSGSTSTSALGTSIGDTADDRARDVEKILSRFPNFVTCNGSRYVTASSVEPIANWRFKRHPQYRK